MTKVFKGESVQRHNRILTQGILRNTEVQVRQVGTEFWNSSDFCVLYFLLELCKTGWEPSSWNSVSAIWRQAQAEMPSEDTLSIAATPDDVDREYLRMLDGGILHEAFHTFYTEKGELDCDRMHQILSDNYRDDIPYREYRSLFKSLWNIYEDSMIERRGMVDFPGALWSLQAVHEMVWEKESAPRNMRIGTQGFDSKGRPIQAFDEMTHLTCYLRDQVENYLDNAPFDEYEPGIRQLLDTEFKDLIDAGRTSKDSYDAFELAMKTLHRIIDLNEPNTGQESGDLPDPSKGDSGASKDSGEGGGKSSDSEGDGDGGDSEGASGEGDESDDKGDSGSRGGDSNDKDTESDSTQGGGGLRGSDQEALRDVLANSKNADQMQDHADVINDLAADQFGEVPNYPLPYTREFDEVNYMKVRERDLPQFKKLSAEVRKDTLYIRSKMVAFLRGDTKTRRMHRQERGRQLSARSIHEVVYKEKPKPFQTKTVQKRAQAVVSIVVDESSSMRYHNPERLLATFAVSLQQLRIPFEVIGFQSGGPNSLVAQDKMARDIERQGFTRTDAVIFNVFRTFDEPLTDKALSKLMQTRTQGGTPLEDGLDFAARRLVERPEERKVLIVLTDGEAWATRGKVYMTPRKRCELANNEAKMLESKGVETVFVGYKHEGVKDFDNHIYISKMGEFGTKMNEYLMSALRQRKF